MRACLALAAALVLVVPAAAEACESGDPPSELSQDLIDVAAHIFSGTVVEIGSYACETPDADTAGAADTCRVELTIAPNESYQGRLMPPEPVPVRFAFSARSYGPAAGDDRARIASGLEADILVMTQPGMLIDGRATLVALEDACAGSQVFATSDPLVADAKAEGRLTPNPATTQGNATR